MTKQSKIVAVNRIKNEIAYIFSDRAHGGPIRKEELANWQRQLKEVEALEVDE